MPATRTPDRNAPVKSGHAKPAPSRNEGEGNKTAARHYNEAQQRYVRSGTVAAAARSARRAVDGPQAGALRQAAAVGRGKARPAKPKTKPNIKR